MCFSIHPDHSDPIIAADDTICYKILGKHELNYYPQLSTFNNWKLLILRFLGFNVFAALAQNHVYIINSRKKKRVIIQPYILNWNKDNPTTPISSCGTIEKGYHSYIKNNRIISDKYEILIECVIPKGTLYYKNPFNEEYVSETIILKKVISCVS